MTSKHYDVNSNKKHAEQNEVTGKASNNDEKPYKISYFQLYRFATTYEYFLIIIGILCSIINSFSLPLTIIIYGEFTTLLVERTYGIGTTSQTVLLHLFGGGKVLTNATIDENRMEIVNDSESYGILLTLNSVLTCITGMLSIDLFNYTALRQITRMRIRLLRSTLKQEIAWYDTTKDNNFAVKITEDIDKIREGISEKVALFISLIMSFLVSVMISFIYGWKLTLVVMACVPVIVVTSVLVSKTQSSLTTKEIDSYSSAGTIAEEVLSSIRTVVAFGGEEKESARYQTHLLYAQGAGRKKGMFTGIGEGVTRLMFYSSNALAFWYGTNLILDDRDKEVKEYTPAVLMIAFFGILVGAENLAKTAPFIETFSVARESATNIFKIIDRISKIDALSTNGKIINYGIKGDIEFKNVTFQYPSRIDVNILKSFNLKINGGESVALIGSSGCGKSTCLQLIERFYDPIGGSITIDGIDLRKLNVSWMRSTIANVGQEPVLFAATIGQNIKYGKPDATQREIEEAANSAGAHDFITNLPESYNTMVGDRGVQLSGGQKQRIAIARALIQNPRILLLDEVTSALDSESEKLVQKALDIATKDRTTLIVSHRLSTIRKAHRIVFLRNGEIIEDGSHNDLMKLKGNYYQMVKAGTLESETFEQTIIENDVDVPDTVEQPLIESIPVNHLDQPHHVHFRPVSYKLEEEDESEEIYYKPILKRILTVAQPEWGLLFLGILVAILSGFSYPAFAVLLGEIYGALSLHNPQDVKDETNALCVSFFVVGLVTAVCMFLQNYLLNLSGVSLTARIRSKMFSAIMRQEMGWFDQESNSIGALCARLAGDAANIQGAIGYPIGAVIQSFAILIFGSSIAFYYLWKMALVCFAFVPFVIGSILFEAKFMSRAAQNEKISLENATKIATEAVANIRTVASLRQESHVVSRFCIEIYKVERSIRKKLQYRGLVFSTGQSVPFFAYAAALYYGGLLVAYENVPYQDIIKVSEALLFGAMMLGQSLAYAPAFTSAFVAAHRVFKVIDRKSRVRSPEIINNSNEELTDKNSDDSNTIKYDNVDFRYPMRPEVPILEGFNLDILSGKTIGLVGPSGCGKSTCMQILQRLYDADNGRVFIGSSEITNDIELPELRSKIGIVSQEPVLFDRTIAENIAYGDNTRKVHLAEIIDAAKSANIHEFIKSLPLGYETNLGSKGTQLSGGQKQRIAIARAVVRNPKILLLDEATSALDTQSEKIVQAALDLARTGRTCLVIAHRLTTIQSADLICVIQGGKIAEHGTHDELISKNGIYAKLYSSQS